MSTPPPPGPPRRILATLAHLAVMGTVGGAVIGVFAAAVATGLGLMFLLGIGIFVLAGCVYAMYGLGWFETARVTGLYRLDVAAPTFAPRVPGFIGWFRTVGRQLKDGPMWRALANFVIAALLGGFLVFVVRQFVDALVLAFVPAATLHLPYGWDLGGWGWVLGPLAALVWVAAAIGLALLHRSVSVAIIGSAGREEALTAEAAQSQAQRHGAVRAADLERTRLERDLHDGVQPRLVSIGMTLGLAHQRIDTDPAAAKDLVAEAHTSTKAAITELRQLARGIHASVLDDRGLDAALSALAGRSHIPVDLDIRLDRRVSRDAEAAVYFVIAETLTNAAKHSRANRCRVTVRHRAAQPPPGFAPQQWLWARVEDNGVGGARVQPGGGLDGIANRVLALGGTFHIDSPAGGPTAVEVNVPCAS